MRRARHPGAVCLAAWVLLVILYAPNARATPHVVSASIAPLAPTPAAMAARVDTYLTGLARAHRFSGAVLLAQRGTVLLRKGYGMADWSRQVPNTSSTPFLLAQSPEEFALAAVLQLEDAGKLHDQDHLCAYIPRCPAAWRPITIHEVLNATTGIEDYLNDPANARFVGRSVSLGQVMALIAAAPLGWTPGTGGTFSPVVPIEEYLVERITGASFAAYLQHHIVGPLGLHHTTYALHDLPHLPGQPVGYLSGLVAAPSAIDAFDYSFLGGMIATTVSDYYRFEQALYTGTLLSAAARKRLLTPSYTWCPPQCDAGFTLGAITQGLALWTWQRHRIVWFSGTLSTVGFASQDAYYPDAQVIVVLLGNEVIAPFAANQQALAVQIF